jgi:peptide/nickel transport system permease protein
MSFPEIDAVATAPGDEQGLTAEGGAVAATGSPWLLVLRTFAQNKLALVGVGIIIFLFVFSFIGPLIHHSDQTTTNIILQNQPPSSRFPLGTDPVGYDVLGRLMVGGQPTLEVGVSVGIVSTLFGVIYGAISGYFGGWVDSLMMRLIDIGLSLPIVVLAIFLSIAFRPTVLVLILLLTVVSWLVPARLVRGEALALRTREYVQAVRGMGGGSGRIIFKHLVPNTIGTIMVTVTFGVANAILTMTVLQFLGFGLPPNVPNWGEMLANGANNIQLGYWWQLWPVLSLVVLSVLAFNFIGDALQDSFNVRLQER